MAQHAGVPFLCEIPLEAVIRIRGDEGRMSALFTEDNPVREPLLRMCEATAIQIAKQLLETPKLPTLEIL